MLTSSPALQRCSSVISPSDTSPSVSFRRSSSSPLVRRAGSPFKPDTLYRAAAKGDSDLVMQQLTDSWLEPNILDEALSRACAAGQLAVAQALILYGAAVEPAKPPPTGMPLIGACEAGNTELVQYLLHRGARINRASFDGDSPLSRASYCGRADIVELMIERRASLDASKQGGAFSDVTPRERAIAGKNTDVNQSRRGASSGDWATCIHLLAAAETAQAIERTRAA